MGDKIIIVVVAAIITFSRIISDIYDGICLLVVLIIIGVPTGIFYKSVEIIGYLGLTFYLVYIKGIKFSRLTYYIYGFTDADWKSTDDILLEICDSFELKLPEFVKFMLSDGLEITLNELTSNQRVLKRRIVMLYKFNGKYVTSACLPDDSYKKWPIARNDYKRIEGVALTSPDLVLQT